MAFNRANFSRVATSGLIGSRNINLWAYVSADAIGTVDNAAYFADLVAEGILNEGDLIYVVSSTGGTEAYALRTLHNVTDVATIQLGNTGQTFTLA